MAALNGLQIFKLLPKTNCGECGVPTCMAFAMKLAAKTVDLAACPYASDEAKTTIGAASNLLIIGEGNTFTNTINLGANTLTVNTPNAAVVTPTFLPFSGYTLDPANVELSPSSSVRGTLLLPIKRLRHLDGGFRHYIGNAASAVGETQAEMGEQLCGGGIRRGHHTQA